ncbi:MAG: dihydrolipoyl dehydrogenase-like [Comamonadaceae bacterium]|nr:MAG: dihydrolipoyl dehydrogenase-like [Comamonadaceae bacterium]
MQFRKWANQIVKDYTIQGWAMDVDRLKPGDTIQADQSLITVDSDKASMEIPSSHGGVVKELKVKSWAAAWLARMRVT